MAQVSQVRFAPLLWPSQSVERDKPNQGQARKANERAYRDAQHDDQPTAPPTQRIDEFA